MKCLGFDLFKDFVHGGLRGPGGVPIRSMHSQGFGRITFQRMQIVENNC
jgi:hypothetical protein